MNPAWVAAAGSFAGIVLGIVLWIARRLFRVFKKTDQFLTDWNGVAGDPGHPGRPGVMERLTRLETAMADIHGQVHLNSGHSLKDVVTRTESAVGQNTAQLAELKQTVDTLTRGAGTRTAQGSTAAGS